MIHSMTGYTDGCCEIELANGAKIQLNLEIKSLNNRFMEYLIRLPHLINNLELKIQDIGKKKLKRGKVFMTARVTNISDVELETVNINMALAQSYSEAAKQISKSLDLENRFTNRDALFASNVIQIEKSKIGPEDEEKILNAVSKEFDKLVETREIEGQEISKDLLQRIELCEQILEKIKACCTKSLETIKEKVVLHSSKMKELTEDSDELILEQKKFVEANHLLDKADVHEEIVRFLLHIKAAKKALESSNIETGKQLDFLAQEMFRETNTIGSKSFDQETSALCIDIKVELEKIREQAHNIV